MVVAGGIFFEKETLDEKVEAQHEEAQPERGVADAWTAEPPEPEYGYQQDEGQEGGESRGRVGDDSRRQDARELSEGHRVLTEDAVERQAQQCPQRELNAEDAGDQPPTLGIALKKRAPWQSLGCAASCDGSGRI